MDLKVKERTKELEANRDLLLTMNNERNMHVSRIFNEVMRSRATVNGLCLLALNDIEDQSARNYLKKINDNTDHLFSKLESFQQLVSV